MALRLPAVPISAVFVFTASAAAVAAWAGTWPLVPTVAGSPGAWRVESLPDVSRIAWTAGLAGVAASAFWVAAMPMFRRHMRRRIGRPAVLLGAAATLALGVALSSPATVPFFCDGAVPQWMLPADYNGSGCAMYPRGWERTKPWAESSIVCLGYCTLTPTMDSGGLLP